MAGKTSVFCICYFGYFLIQQEPVYLSDLLWPSFLFAITPVTASAAKLSSITTPHSAGSPASPVCGVLLPAESCCEDALCPRSGRGLSEASGFYPLPLSELPELLEVSELAELSELELPELFELLSSGSVGFSSSVGASS